MRKYLLPGLLIMGLVAVAAPAFAVALPPSGPWSGSPWKGELTASSHYETAPDATDVLGRSFVPSTVLGSSAVGMQCTYDDALRYYTAGSDPNPLFEPDRASSVQPASLQFASEENCTGTYTHFDINTNTFRDCAVTIHAEAHVTKPVSLTIIYDTYFQSGWSAEGTNPNDEANRVEADLSFADPCGGVEFVPLNLDPEWYRETISAIVPRALANGTRLAGTSVHQAERTQAWNLEYLGEVLPSSGLEWSVRPQTRDVNKDGLVEMATSELSTALPDNGRNLVDVDINACGITPAGFTYQLDFNVPDHADTCASPINMDVGTHTLTVWPDGGDPSQTLVLAPRQQIVVGMGDSYGSGETRSDKGSWYDANCRRGAWSAQTRSALALEESDPKTSVIFVHVACSGATVNKGLLGPYPEPPGKGRVKLSQVKRIKELLGGRKIDAVLLSIGGNDIGFAKVIKTCARYEDCPLTKKRGLTGAAFAVKKTLHQETQGKLKKLPGLLDKVAQCVTVGGYCEAKDWKGGNLGVSPSKVLQTAYPDIATSSNKDLPPVSAGNGHWYCAGALQKLGGISPREFEWAREVVQMGEAGTKFNVVIDLGPDRKVKVTKPGLNNVVGEGPFTAITGAYKLFHGHGYCAPKKSRWITTFLEAKRQSTAPFHPNKVGYEKWSTVITPALIKAVGR